MLSRNQEFCPTTSLDEICIKFDFQTDRNYMASKLKFVKDRGYELYISKEVKKEHKEEAKADVKKAEEEQELPVFFVIHVNNILHSIFFRFGSVHQNSPNLQL